ncbi:MAG: D-aminoacylase [Gemmatimonadota bacterium]|nr:D-aminoacylase [Gemmatimonadota bacterium]
MRNRAKFRGPAGLLALGVTAFLCACVDGGDMGAGGDGSVGTSSSGAGGPMDVVIEGGRVVDGTGAGWFHGDVGIRGDRIAAVTHAGGLAEVDAGTRVDAAGKVVAPGFIDIQSHARGPLLSGDGRLLGKITQGITTEIMGEGWTNAPANANTDAGAGLVDPEAQGERHDFSGPRGFDAWLNAMLANGASPNFGSFVGATTIRVYAMGEAGGPASEAQLDSMRKATRWAMEGGAFGVATALIYPPGNFAGTDELVEVVAASEPYGGLYITHMRSEADRFLEAIDEAIEIGERGGVPVEIYHLKAAGVRNHYKAALAVAKIDSARAAGIDVQANMYPYIAGGTGISALFPPWASEDGRLLDNLSDPAMRQRIHAEVLADGPEWENFGTLSTPEGVLVTSVGETGPDGEPTGAERYVGMRLAEVAADMGVDWVEAAMEITLMTSGHASMVIFMMSEENVAMQLRQPWIKIGTDASGFDPADVSGMVHPRSYGTYPRILGKYVRGEGVITLEDAIRKMTSAVATRLSIHDRGVLRPGMYADVVVFDPTTVADRATFEDPHQLSVGIEEVFVNGVMVLRGGEHTGAKPGRIVRGPGYRPAG